MLAAGWKTIVISHKCNLSFKSNCLHIEGEETYDVPIDQIKVILIESLQVCVTTYLLNELQKHRVMVVVCDEKHMPGCEVIPKYPNSNQTGMIFNQINWTEELKDSIWQSIVKTKIGMQIECLRGNGIDTPDLMEEYLANVELGDTTNREGAAARVYFSSLFGTSFVRHSVSDLNAILDYGYSIVLSQVTRKIVTMGYLTNIGIHHRGVDNLYNLACDLMEPFRPFVDNAVYGCRDMKLDNCTKRLLIESLYEDVKFEGKRMQLQYAIDSYVERSLGLINGGCIPDYKLGFAG